MPVPAEPKIYHIVHVDRLSSIVADGHLWCDAEIAQRNPLGTTIGISSIKERRLRQPLTSHPDLRVGDCVPFYFCPRSIMLYLIYITNHSDLTYTGGQDLIIHLEADLRQTVSWAKDNNQRWAFTLSNAGANYFEDRCNLEKLNEINWAAVAAKYWQNPDIQEGKQAEFLIECQFPWELVSRIGLREPANHQTLAALQSAAHKPCVEIKDNWYY